MAKRPLNHLLGWIRGLARAPAAPGETDRQLLERFAARDDEAAFAALVQRHGALVWGVCRRVLRNEHDAEDAFQAVFLVLARKAGSVRWREDVGNWLYDVAGRVADKARVQAARRRLKERQASPMPTPQTAGDDSEDELRSALHEEVRRLPENYRAPIVLCYLKGKTYAEAAQLLGWAEGTVSGRLARARDLLHSRLVRRGLTLSGGALAAALSQGAGSAAPPAVVVQATIRAVVVFAAGAPAAAGAVSHQAVVLAEGVLKAMLLTKLRIAVPILLVVGLAGSSAGVLTVLSLVDKLTGPAEQVTPQPAANRVIERAPLKKAWVGRWQPDPFAGTEWIEVQHRALRGDSRTCPIKEPTTVAALLKELRITAIDNGIARGNKPPATLGFHKKDGSTFTVSVADDGTIQARGAEIRVDRGFLDALNRHLCEKQGRAVNILQFLPAPPEPPALKRQPIVRPTLNSVKAGFKSLSVRYPMGKRWREVRVTDQMALDELHRALTVVKHETDKGRKGLPGPALTIAAKDKATLIVHLLNDQQLFIWDVGRLTITPSFLRALNRQVSRLEGREVNVLGENKLTAQQVTREKEFRKLLSGATAIRVVNKKENSGPQVIDEPADAAALVQALAWVEVPLAEVKLPAGDLSIEVTSGKGRKVELTYLQTGPGNERVAVGPWGDLVNVSGFGQLWLDNQWKYLFRDYTERLQRDAEQRKFIETVRLVCSDLPAFKEQVINVAVKYNQGGKYFRRCLGARRSWPILDALAVDRVEKLAWTRLQWAVELARLGHREPGSLELTPGLGFSLPLLITGEKEMLIPMYGRVTFKTSPLAAIRKAVESDPEKQASVGLLPR